MLLRQRDAEAQELLDAASFDDAALARNLRDIRVINALLGWTTFTTRAVAREVRAQQLSAAAPYTLLDVASGSADMPLAIARWARRAGTDLRVTATDLSPQIVAIAREQLRAAGYADVHVEQQDALALTYDDGAFDIALCTLALHHFAPDAAVTLLRELARVARRVLVFDAVRSPLAYVGVIALTRALRMHPMTCHDAPVSVRRAYSAAELRSLAQRAGLRDTQVTIGVPFRLALVASGTAQQA